MSRRCFLVFADLQHADRLEWETPNSGKTAQVNLHLLMNPSTREDFVWLISDEAAPVLRKVQQAFEDRFNAVRIAKSLRKKTTPTRAALIMEQAQLRIRGRRKFSQAAEMFFTRRGLEQATGKRIASYKAGRFAQLSNVADICCGIGGDLIALAKRDHSDEPSCRTIAIDSDEHTCLFAKKNVEVNCKRSGEVTFRQIDFADFDLSDLDGIHIDPDRRVKSRTVQGNQFSPKLHDVFERLPPGCSAAIKVAPATPIAEYMPSNLQREWIGDHRECKQQVLWAGPATAQPGHRTATYIGKNGLISQISVPEMELDRTIEVSSSLQKYIFEPHPTVLAAGLTDVLARKYGLRRFTASIVYLTGDQPVDDPLLSQFEILEVLSLNLRKTIQSLQSLDVGQVEIKKRGVDNVTAEMFARMKIGGSHAATVILTRLGKKRISVIARRS